METVKLGLSEVDITPDSPVQTVGFGRVDELSRGILHGLSAQVSVWELNREKCCLRIRRQTTVSKKNIPVLLMLA